MAERATASQPIMDPLARRATVPRVLMLVEGVAGGTGSHLASMLESWDADGWDRTIITQEPVRVPDLPGRVEVRVLARAGWYDRFPLGQVRRLGAIARFARRYRPAIVHSYFFWSIIYGRMLKFLGRVPRLVENREDLGFSWGPVEYAILRLTSGLPDRIICVAEAVRRVVVQREGAPPQRTIVIPNGIAMRSVPAGLREATRTGLGIAREHIVVGMVANIHRAVKGGHHFLDAIPAIVREVPTARFLMVGLATDRSALEPQLEARGIGEYVIGLGHQADVEPYYAAMDISVLTSLSEGLSITLLESMARGLPIVATRVGGNPDLVVEGETGHLVPPADVPAFVRRVVELARDAGRRQAMGAAARERIAQHFSIDVVADRYRKVYATLLGDADEPRQISSSASNRIPAW